MCLYFLAGWGRRISNRKQWCGWKWSGSPWERVGWCICRSLSCSDWKSCRQVWNTEKKKLFSPIEYFSLGWLLQKLAALLISPPSPTKMLLTCRWRRKSCVWGDVIVFLCTAAASCAPQQRPCDSRSKQAGGGEQLRRQQCTGGRTHNYACIHAHANASLHAWERTCFTGTHS